VSIEYYQCVCGWQGFKHEADWSIEWENLESRIVRKCPARKGFGKCGRELSDKDIKIADIRI